MEQNRMTNSWKCDGDRPISYLYIYDKSATHPMRDTTIIAITTTLLLTLRIVAEAVNHHQAPLAMGQGNNNNTATTKEWPNIMLNVETFVVSNVTTPRIDDSAYIHPFAVVIGDCFIGKEVLAAPTAVCRGDEGVPLLLLF
jgi:carbonic anhydrase